MSEIAAFVRRGASKITPQIVRGVCKKLPLLKLQFAEIHARSFPHLPEQLQFLANVLEDFADNKADDLPYVTLANVAFAVIYSNRAMDLIPDSMPEMGMADDSAVVRAVLIEHEAVLSRIAERIGTSWKEITTEA